jgi:hypothetical protein
MVRVLLPLMLLPTAMAFSVQVKASGRQQAELEAVAIDDYLTELGPNGRKGLATSAFDARLYDWYMPVFGDPPGTVGASSHGKPLVAEPELQVARRLNAGRALDGWLAAGCASPGR